MKMKGTTELETKRLCIRRHRIEDAEPLYEKFGRDPRMYEYSGWNPYGDLTISRETVQRYMDCYDKEDFYGWAIEYMGELIGTIGAYDYDQEKSQIEIGVSIARNFWGRGFAAEALSAVLKYLTEHEMINTVTAWCANDNIGSRKAMEKAGMEMTGIREKELEVEGKKYDKAVYRYTIHSDI